MSTTRLFVEAVDTTGRLADALTNWIIFLAVTAAILALAAVACGAWAVNVAWGRLYGRWRRAGGPGVESEPQPTLRGTERRSRPSWAHEQPTNHQEAA